MTILNYTVNYMDVAMVAVVIIAAVVGYVRGIMTTLVRFIRLAVGMFLCFYFSSYYTQPVYESLVKPRLLATINEKIATSGNIDEIIGNLNQYIAGLPKFIGNQLDVKSVNISSENIALSILNNVFEPVALTATKIALFLAVFLIFFISTGIIIAVVKHHNKKKEKKRGHPSALKKTDRLMGLLFGLLKSAILLLAVTSVLMYIMSINEALPDGSPFWREVQNSSLLKYMNELNPFNAITEGLL